MATKKNEVAAVEQQNTALAMPADFSQFAGMGMEEADKSSFAIPFVTMLQGLSPQLETVDGARPGLFINTITNELFKAVRVVPCAFQRRFIRWAPRETGGGYKGDFSPIDVETGKLAGAHQNEEGQWEIEGDRLSDTRNHYVLFEDANGAWRPALISLSSTQIKKSKRWMSLIQGIQLRNPAGRLYTPPSFSHIYKLGAVKEKNAKGEWWGLDVTLDGPITDGEVFNMAMAFHKSVAAGEVQVQEPVEDVAGESSEGF